VPPAPPDPLEPPEPPLPLELEKVVVAVDVAIT
jgi:hypothetical protein